MMPTFHYPLFEENQVLSFQHLNQLAEFLEDSDRATRRALLGAGVVYGLDLRWSSASGVTLGPGAALTTAGYLCHLEAAQVFTAARSYTDPTAYAPFLDAADTQQFPLWELVPAADSIASDTNLAGAAGAAFLGDKTAILFLESTIADLDHCIDNHCINQGSEYRLVWRVIVANRTDVTAMRNAALAGAVPWPAWNLADLRFQRLLLTASNVASVVTLGQAGRTFLSSTTAALRSGLRAAIALYGTRLEVPPTLSDQAVRVLETDFDAWLAQLPGAGYLRWQQGLDHLRHVHLAWGAFVEAAFGFVSQPAPLSEPFPRHVLLGEIPPAPFPPPSLLRHRFVPSPALTLGGVDRVLCRQRFVRLLTMASSFSITSGTAVRVTPGAALPSPLDDQAIPFYYLPANILGTWSQAASYRGLARRLPCYHREALEAVPFAQDPLRFRVAEPGFYRIEGHLGRTRALVEQAVNDTRRAYQLPFDFVTLRFGPADEDEDAACLCDLDQIRGLYLVTAAEIRCHLARLLGYLGRLVRTDVGTGSFVAREADGTISLNFSNAGFFVLAADFRETPPSSEKRAGPTRARPASGAFATSSFPSRVDIITAETGSVDFGTVLITYPIIPASVYPQLTPIALANSLALELMGRLTEADHRLTSTLEAFDPETFTASIASARTKAADLRDALTTLLAGEVSQVGTLTREDIDVFRQELVIFLANCVPTRIQQVAALYAERLSRLGIIPTLASFLARHPGLEHLGGVPRGGTFVIVCGPPVGTASGSDRVDAFVASGSGRDRQAAAAGRRSRAAVAAAPRDQITDAQATASERAPSGTLLSVILEGGSLADDVAENLLAATDALVIDPGIAHLDLDQVVDDLRDRFQPGPTEEPEIVLADFCLPYVCCSSCLCTTTVVIPPPAIVLTLPQASYCASDPAGYPFNLQPPGGEVTGPGVVDREDHFEFQPFAVDPGDIVEGEVTFTYTLSDGSSTTLSVDLVAPPSLDVAAGAPATVAGGVSVAFTNTTNGDATFLWDFGDEGPLSTSTDRAPTHLYTEPGDYTVTVTATDGPCTVSTTLTVTIETFSITLPDNFCANDETAHEVRVAPPNGNLEGPGVAGTAETGFTFTPSAADVSSGAITLVYRRGTESVSRTVTLHAPPVVQAVSRITGTPSPEGADVVFTATSASAPPITYTWRIDGEAQGTSGSTVTRRLAPGPHTAVLEAVQGPCTVLVTLPPIQVPLPAPTLTVGPRFCANTTDPQDILVAPRGGTITVRRADGAPAPGAVQASGDQFDFFPNRVGQPGAVTLTYTLSDGQSASATTVLQSPPDLVVGSENSEVTVGETVRFFNRTTNDPNSPGTLEFQWTFDDGVTSFDREPTHVYPVARRYEVSVVATSGPCEVRVPEPIVITVRPREVPPPTIRLRETDATEFCANDERSYAVAVTPPGGRLAMNGTLSPDLVFSPLSFQGANSVSLEYTVNDRSARLSLTLVSPVIPIVLAQIVDTTQTQVFIVVRIPNLGESQATQWDPGDGSGFQPVPGPEFAYTYTGRPRVDQPRTISVRTSVGPQCEGFGSTTIILPAFNPDIGITLPGTGTTGPGPGTTLPGTGTTVPGTGTIPGPITIPNIGTVPGPISGPVTPPITGPIRPPSGITFDPSVLETTLGNPAVTRHLSDPGQKALPPIRQINNTAKNALSDAGTRRLLNSAAGERRLGTEARNALVPAITLVRDAASNENPDVIQRLWEFAQVAFSATLFLAASRSSDLAEGSATATAINKVAQDLRAAGRLPKLRRLRYNEHVSSLLEALQRDANRPVLQNLARALAEALPATQSKVASTSRPSRPAKGQRKTASKPEPRPPSTPSKNPQSKPKRPPRRG